MKTKPVLVCALSFLALLPNASAADVTPAPVIVIYNTTVHPPPRLPGETSTHVRSKLVTALWNDGRIVWSGSHVGDGPPYQQGRFDRDELASLLGSLEMQGAFTNAALQRRWSGPDASTTRIVVNDGRHRLEMESWHELFETKTNLIVTAQGVGVLQGRDRVAVQQEQPMAYRYFRKTWSEIRDGVASLIPDKGEPYEGELSDPNEWR